MEHTRRYHGMNRGTGLPRVWDAHADAAETTIVSALHGRPRTSPAGRLASSAMPEGFTLLIETVDRVVRVSPVGELDIASVPALTEGVGPLIDERPDTVTIDAGGLAFLDSSGVRALLMLKQRADAKGVEWSIVNVSRAALRTVNTLRMADVLNVVT